MKRTFRKSFSLLVERSVNALHLGVWVRKELAEQFFKTEVKQSFLGGMGMIPNKAFITVSFELKNERFLVANLHLPHGNLNSKKREECLRLLMHKIRRKKQKYDQVIVMGDFNFRSQMAF